MSHNLAILFYYVIYLLSWLPTASFWSFSFYMLFFGGGGVVVGAALT